MTEIQNVSPAGELRSVIWHEGGRSVGAFVPPREGKDSFFSRGTPPVCDKGWTIEDARSLVVGLYGDITRTEEKEVK